MKDDLSRHVFGLAAIAFGLCALRFHDINTLHQLKALAGAPREAFSYAIAAIEILAGAALQWRTTARGGAVALSVVYLFFALLGLPYLVMHPLVYNSYGNFFEQFSLFAAAVLLYASPGFARAAYYTFGVCLLSFALEQWFYLAATASLVPKWIPPGQTFWAIATTVAFALAAVAVLSGIQARLAVVLSTTMLFGFLLLVWVPALVAAPSSFENWSEAIETLAIAASAWVVADALARWPKQTRAPAVSSI